MDAGEILTDWKVYPSFLIGWLLLGALYVIAIGPLRRRYAKAARVELARPILFAAGLGVTFVALQGPLHELSDHYLFSAHMVQHLLVTLVVPPLLLAGTPGWLAELLLRPAAVRRAARALTRPLVAFGVYNAVFALWHVPALYDLVMRDHDVHIAMHLSIMAAAVLLWWPVVTPVRELNHLSYGAQMLYFFLLGVAMTPLAAIISLADGLLYPWYASAPRLWGLTPHVDQQLGGLIMWMGGSVLVWAGMTVAFFKWSARKERSEPARPPIRRETGLSRSR